MNVVYTDNGFGNTAIEHEIIESGRGELRVHQCKTEDDVIGASSDADALLVQWAPITARVIESLPETCRLIVRIGIGYDNVDLRAARDRGIDVCNVPDYCTDEVADHTMALALALLRQVAQTDSRTRKGTWSITTERPIHSFSEQTFVTIGFGRIARAVLDRARGFRFKLAAVDPHVPAGQFEQAGVTKLDLDEAFRRADVVSLHCGLYDDTYHLIDAERIETMKSSAIVVNTSRGGLVDAEALSNALGEGRLSGAGLDVYEKEPLADDSPLRSAPNTLLTSHVAWYSTESIIRLRELAAKEIVRYINGEQLLHVVN